MQIKSDMQVPAQIVIGPDLTDAISKQAFKAIQNAANAWGREAQYPNYLTKKEAASFANISLGTLNQYIKHGLHYSQINQTVRIKRDDIAKFLQDHSY